jgi:glycosyltransferase involved in cell wall biosynthesis
MRIAIDASRAVVARPTGTERYSLELIRALLRLDQQNAYCLYFNQPPPDSLIPAGPNWRARVAPRARLWTHTRLGPQLAHDRPDLLFVPAHVLPLGYRGRSVVTVHDLGFRFFPRAHPTLARWYLELSTRWAARRASQLIAISRTTARDLSRCYGVSPDRVRVVYEGVGSGFHPVSDQAQLTEVRRRHGLETEPYLFTVGTIQPRKNLLVLLRALRLLLDSSESPVLLAVGGRFGWGSRLEAEVAQLGLESRVRRLGYIADEDLPSLYSGALAYVQPSLYEGFGLTVLEAMACGTPVVAAIGSALPEVVGQAGLLVNPERPDEVASAVGRLIADEALARQLAAAGLARAASFTWERCARETLAVLLEAGTADQI